MPCPVNIHAHRRIPGEEAVVSYRLGSSEPVPEAPYSAGIHPWDASSVDTAACLEELGRLNPAAVGEAGLDRMRGPDLSVQEKVFRKQLAAAAERRLPVIVHCVRAYGELLRIMKDYPGLPFAVHGFTGSPQLAESILKAGGRLSFGFGFPASPRTTKALGITPADRLFFESDMRPEPVEKVYHLAAETRNESYERLVGQVYRNYLKFFIENDLEQPYGIAVRDRQNRNI